VREAARIDLARFIASCYYQPEPAFAEERLFDSIRACAALLDPGLGNDADRLAAAFATEALQDLLVDYGRLFLGPGEALARPYASSWLGGGNGVLGEPALEAQRLYAQGDFEVDAGFADLPDHVAVELEFLYLMQFREAAARRDGELAEARQAAALRERFVHEHLGRWLGPFLAALQAGATTAFYKALAELTGRYVRLAAGSAGPLTGAEQAPVSTPAGRA
jgi:TorA maturation chaperone TorD